MNEPEPNPIEPEQKGAIASAYPFHIDGTLYFPLGSTLPTNECICCCKPAKKTVAKALRSAKLPLSWYLPRPTVEIGLCKKHLEDRAIAHALTFSLLGIGLLLLVAGIFTVSVSMIVGGTVATGISGLFRARESIQGKDVGDDTYEITGSCQAYIWQLQEHEAVEESAPGEA